MFNNWHVGLLYTYTIANIINYSHILITSFFFKYFNSHFVLFVISFFLFAGKKLITIYDKRNLYHLLKNKSEVSL